MSLLYRNTSYKPFSLHPLRLSASSNETHISYKAQNKLQINYCYWFATTRHLLNKCNQSFWHHDQDHHVANVQWKELKSQRKRCWEKIEKKKKRILQSTPLWSLFCLWFPFAVPSTLPTNPPRKPTLIPATSILREWKAPAALHLEHPGWALTWVASSTQWFLGELLFFQTSIKLDKGCCWGGLMADHKTHHYISLFLSENDEPKSQQTWWGCVLLTAQHEIEKGLREGK